jgi:hypothetical protein
VIDDLLERGVAPSNLGLLMTDRTAERALGRPEARDSRGAISAFSGGVHAIVADMKPLAALATAGAGLVATGPLAAALISAGLGSRGGFAQALQELGITRDAAEIAHGVTNGAVLVSVTQQSDADVPEALAKGSELFWRLPLHAPLTRSAVVTAPLAPVADRSARYRPVIESPDEARRSTTGATKHGT